MKRIRLCFHKPKPTDYLGQGIRFWTWLVSSKNRTVPGYDHVEIWTPNEMGIFSDAEFEVPKPVWVVGTCWTSTMRGDNNGTVNRPACEIINNPLRWDVYEREITDEQYNMLMAYMELQVSINKGYSFRDIGKFFGLGFLTDAKRNICSEFSNNSLYEGDILDEGGVVSPRRLAYLITKSGGWKKIEL